MTTTFKCEACGGVFECAWSDEDAKAEAAENFPTLAAEDAAVVCDDCYQQMRAAFHG